MKQLFYILSLLLMSTVGLVQAQGPDKLLTKIHFNGINISGEEYWVFDDDKPGSPYAQNRIIWSYRSAPITAKKCARVAYDKLSAWLKDHDSLVYKSMKAYTEITGVKGIFLWVNDYSKAPKQSKSPRKSRLWIYQKRLYKFESTLMPDGKCHTPSEKQVVNFINAKLVAKGLEKVQGELNGSNIADSIAIDTNVVDDSPRRSWWPKLKNFFNFREKESTESSPQ
ncbi:MAG: hypothetical protein HN576_01245 [Bacteriovoracaceae bacterium]|jgi:hypothetical protein|nr:hypothetical protein [Bacteriovoracaceae bacterium]